jgi:hypothetical protein
MPNISRVALCALVLLSSLPRSAQASASEHLDPSVPSTLEKPLERAFSEDNGEICFWLPEGLVDWKKLARASLGKWHFENPDRKYLGPREREQGNDRPVHLWTPVPTPVAERWWQILHEGGSLLFIPDRLRLEVTYHVDWEDPYRLKKDGEENPRTSGRACGAVANRKLRAGFAVSAGAGLWLAESLKWTTWKDGRIAIKTAEGLYILKPPSFAVPRIRKIQLFRPEGLPPRALVSWNPRGEGGRDAHCEFSLSLYELRPGGKAPMIAENGYGCDV